MLCSRHSTLHPGRAEVFCPGQRGLRIRSRCGQLSRLPWKRTWGSLGEASSADSHSITPVQAAAANKGERPPAASEGSMPEAGATGPVKERRRGSTPEPAGKAAAGPVKEMAARSPAEHVSGPAKPGATGQKKKRRLRVRWEARKRRARGLRHRKIQPN